MLTSLALALVLGTAPVSSASDTLRADTEIRQVVLRHAADVRRCYEREGLRRNPELSGLIEIQITILPTGRVNDVSLARSSISGRGVDEVVRCISSAARHWRFDRGAYPVETIVFPFQLAPVKAQRRLTNRWGLAAG